jgi:hypothetical protein
MRRLQLKPPESTIQQPEFPLTPPPGAIQVDPALVNSRVAGRNALIEQDLGTFAALATPSGADVGDRMAAAAGDAFAKHPLDAADLGTFASLAEPTGVNLGNTMAEAAAGAFASKPLESADLATFAGLNTPTFVDKVATEQRAADLGILEGQKTPSVQLKPVSNLDFSEIDTTSFVPFKTLLQVLGTEAGDGMLQAASKAIESTPIRDTAVDIFFEPAITASTGKGDSAGQNFGTGVANGIAANNDAVFTAGLNLMDRAKAGADTSAKSSSPSREMMMRGQWFVEGLALGIDEHAHKAKASAGRMTDSLQDMIGGTMGSPKILASVTATGPDQVSMGDGPGVDRIVRAIGANRQVHPNARRRLPFGGQG